MAKRFKEIIDPQYYKRLAEVESSNNPNAKAATSSAVGLYQFTQGTWKGLVKQLGLDYTLEDRTNPEKSKKVVEEFTKQNRNYLKNKLGKEPNNAEIYIAHFLGMGGSSKLLQALKQDPNTTIDTIVTPSQIKANRTVFLNKDGSFKEAKDIYNWAANKFGEKSYSNDEVVPKKKVEDTAPHLYKKVEKDNTAVGQTKFYTPNTQKIVEELKFQDNLFKTPPPIENKQPQQTIQAPTEIIKNPFEQVVRQEAVQPQQQLFNTQGYELYQPEENEFTQNFLQKGGEIKKDNTNLNFTKINKNLLNLELLKKPTEKEDILLNNYDKYNTFGPQEDLDTIHLDEVVVTGDKVKIKTEYYNEDKEIKVNKKSKLEDIFNTQKLLIEKGYNLNPEGRFKNDGVDGKIGEVTKTAIEDYNKNIKKNNIEYNPTKEGVGFLGNCTETQCSEYIQNELYRNINPGIDRKEWNSKLGVSGDAWNIGKNIVKKGGKEIAIAEKKQGDVITLFTGGRSQYQEQANKAGTGTTHTALIDKVNPDGSYYILHNVHEKNYLTGEFEGYEYRDLVKDGRIQGDRSWGQVKSAFRPNYENIEQKNPKVKIKEGIKVLPKIGISNNYLKPLEDKQFKKTLIEKEGIDEDEFYSLSKAALGIMGQETKFGEDATYKYKIKTLAAKGAKSLGLKDNEVSLGPGSMKIDTNFNSADIGAYNVYKNNIEEPENAVKATLVKLSRDYKRMLKKGFEKKDALYRAIQIYNGALSTVSAGKTREDWAKEYDLDYVNKVINFGSKFELKDKSKNFFTTFDELKNIDSIASWENYVNQELKE